MSAETNNQESVENKEVKQNNMQTPNPAKPNSKEATSADFPQFEESKSLGVSTGDKFNFLKDMKLNVYIELGKTQMEVKDILELERGYVIELDKLASEPVDIYVNNKKIAEGEVVVIDKHFGIRILNLADTTSYLQGIA